jgi:hypothetical protein
MICRLNPPLDISKAESKEDKIKYMIMLLQKKAHLSDQVMIKFVKLLNQAIPLYDSNAGNLYNILLFNTLMQFP